MHVSAWIISSSWLCHLGAAAFVLDRRHRLDHRIQDSIFARNAQNRPSEYDNEKAHHELQIDQALSTSTHSKMIMTRTSVVSGVAATMIAAAVSAPSMCLALPFPTASTTTTLATDSIEISKGALVIQTASESLLKSSIDSKSLLKALFTNRKEISASVRRIQSTVSSELQNPAWKNILRELVEVEDDLAGSVQVYPPEDIKVALQDLASGKLNLLVNGEIVNVVVDESFGKDEDEIKVTIKGFKQGQVARTIPTFSEPKYGPIRTYFSRYEGFWSWWETPYPDQYLLPGMAATNGEILLTGTAGTIWLIYVSAYGYYQYEREQELLASQEKKAKLDAAKQNPTPSVGKKKTFDEALTEEFATKGSETQQEQKQQLPTFVEREESNETKNGSVDEVSPTPTMNSKSKPVKTGLSRLGRILFWRKRRDD